MHARVARFAALRLFLFCLAVLTSSVAFGQGTTIEPCPGTAVPTKPTVSGSKVSTVKSDVKVSETLVDSSVPDDSAVESILAPYEEKVRSLSLVIGRLETDLKKIGPGAGSVGSFVADGIKFEAERRLGRPVAYAVVNAGGLRKNDITSGELRASDIFELLPFENTLLAVDVTGTQLSKLISLAARDAQSGARIQFKWNDQNRAEFITGKLVDAAGREVDLDPGKIYTIVTIDYLYKLKSGPYAVLQEARNLTPLNITIRDAMIDYVKAETAAGRAIKAHSTDRFIQIGPDPTGPIVPND